MSPADFDLSVIVVIHDSGDLALDTLRSARGVCDGLRTKWLVVDSGSTDDTAERIAREWSDVTIIRGDKPALQPATNRRLRRARGRYVLLFNPDEEIASRTISQLVIALDERPDVAAASVVQRGRSPASAGCTSTSFSSGGGGLVPADAPRRLTSAIFRRSPPSTIRAGISGRSAPRS